MNKMSKRIFKYLIIIVLVGNVWFFSSLTPFPVFRDTAAQAVSPLWDGSVAASFAGGTGTEADPYLISNGAQLAYLAQRVNSGSGFAGQNIKLTQDILLNEMNNGAFVSPAPRAFTRIGSSEGNSFKGNFNGSGYKIIGLYINIESWIHYGGLFGYAAAGSAIRNLGVTGVVNGGYETGTIAGYTKGLIAGCDVSCKVTGAQTHAGGIAGYAGAGSEINNCTVSGSSIYARTHAGGVAGQTEGIITDCSVDGMVTANDFYVGGIVGYASGQSVISNTSVAGTVSGRSYVGGVAGATDKTVLTGCQSNCTVTGYDFYVGGVAGYAGTGSEISYATVAGTATGRSYIGGVAGYTDGLIEVCINNGAVSGLEEKIGGVAGYADSHNSVSNCLNKGSVTATGGNRSGIGGIVGSGNWADPASAIHNNLSIGAVSGRVNVGGIAGQAAPPLGVQDAWNNYYTNAPAGTGAGDVPARDGAVSVGNRSWLEIIDLLNSDNPAGDDIWTEDEDGIPIPRVFAPDHVVGSFNARIKEGKCFTASQVGESTAAAITSDSVFTVVFSATYSRSYDPAAQTLGLSQEGAVVPLPANTSIIMLVDGAYYYKNLGSGLGTKLVLGEFIKMGSLTEHYAPASWPAESAKEYLFIFDFSRATPGVSAGTCKVELLLPAAGSSTGPAPSLTVTGANAYALEASGTAGSYNLSFSRTGVAGYDYKTDGKSYAFELALQQGGLNVPWPIGAGINGVTLNSALPYVFAAASFGNNSVSIDLSGCINLPGQGNYDLQVQAYACNDATSPREGYLLASGSTTLTITEPVQYAIRAGASTRVFDKSTAAIPVSFAVDTLGPGSVKSTLQRKYGTSYVNIEDQTNLPVSLAGGGATLIVPAGYEAGTYRFVLTLYDAGGHPRAQAAESLIIKE